MVKPSIINGRLKSLDWTSGLDSSGLDSSGLDSSGLEWWTDTKMDFKLPI